jgi:hypothetical protein
MGVSYPYSYREVELINEINPFANHFPFKIMYFYYY